MKSEVLSVTRMAARAILINALCAATQLGATELNSIERKFNALKNREQETLTFSDKVRAELLEKTYEQLFRNEQRRDQVKAHSDHDLTLLFQAARVAAFYTFDDPYIRDLELDLTELQNRGLAQNQHYGDLYYILIGARQLDKARSLAKKHPSADLDPLPVFHSTVGSHPTAPTAWIVDMKNNAVLRQEIALDPQIQIIVIGSPLCHFSQNAAQEIQADPVLGPVFRRHAKWIAPQDDHLHINAFQQWNSENPDAAFAITYRMREWRMIDSWATPTFYFFKDGQLEAKVVGWPPKDGRIEIDSALDKLGLVNRN